MKAKNIRYNCENCGKQFTSMPSLTRHINNIHRRIIKHRYDHCEKEFKTKDIRHRHEQNEQKKYSCSICDFQAIEQSSLNFHMKSKHKS